MAPAKSLLSTSSAQLGSYFAPVAELFRTVAFRMAIVLAISFTTITLLLFAFIYWQATTFEDRRTDSFLMAEEQRISSRSDINLLSIVDTRQTEGYRRLTDYALFTAGGERLAGNLIDLPRDLPLNGRTYSVILWPVMDGAPHRELARAIGLKLPESRILIIGRGLDEVTELRQVVLRALLLGVIPATILILAFSALVSWRAVNHVKAIDETLKRIIRGHRTERLPIRGTSDSLDRLLTSVNGMLDKTDILLDDLRSVGDSIAHDLRTPLTRIRARLESCRVKGVTEAALHVAVDQSIIEIDQAASFISALLRIGEIEDERRQSGFAAIDLGLLFKDLLDDYLAVAEERELTLSAQCEDGLLILGDFDLVTEALANLLENALKFTPAGGNVFLGSFRDSKGVVMAVSDDGPGIPAEEHGVVFERFFRGDRSRHVAGSGLGLSLVHAVCRMHGFSVAVIGGPPGCRIEILCPAERCPPRPSAARPPGAASRKTETA
jgi:signal transduction histidine kinase